MRDETVRVDVLGTPRTLRNGSAVSADTRKATALLAYLAVEGVTRRDTLAALLWPESSDSQARATLRRTLSAVRSALGPSAVATDHSEVSLAEGVKTDVGDFATGLAQLGTHDHDDDEVCSRCIPVLRSAATLYRGDFLAGFSLRDSPQFEDWTRVVAERFRMDCERQYERLALAEAAEGDYGAAIDAVNSWLEIAPLREPAYRLLMLMYGWAGDGPGATGAYRRCVATLQNELGVTPLEETTELLEAILDQDLPPAPGVRRRIVAMPSRTIGSPRLFGRVTQLEALTSAIGRDGTLIRIVGEAWMGKTRMLEEAAAMAEAQGTETISARGYATEQDVPYGVVSQILATLTAKEDWDARRSAIPAWALSETARISPGIADRSAEGPSDPFRELRLRDGIVEVLAAMEGLLLIDDAQWSDQSSLSVLGLLAERLSVTRLIMLVAHRPETSEAFRPLTAMAERLPNLTIRLPRLRPDDVEGDHDNDVIGEVIERTGGVPALVADALTHEPRTVALLSTRDYLEDRLSGASNLTRQVLTAASVLGGSVGFDLLRATCGRSDNEVLEGVEWLITRGVLESSGEDRVQFALDAVRELTYEDSTLFRRRILHRRAAATLEAHGMTTTDSHRASAIARHLRLGGLDRESAVWYETAGRMALDLFAPRDAIEHLVNVLALGQGELAAIHLLIGEAHLQLSQYSEALAKFELAASLADRETLALAEHKVGEANRRLGHIDKAFSQYEKATPNHPDPASLYSDWALAALRAGDRSKAIAKAEQALASTEASSQLSQSRAMTALGIVIEDAAASRSLLEQALTLAAEDQGLRMAALNAIAHEESQQGNAKAAMDRLEQALEIAVEIGDRHRQAALLDHLADLYHREGNRDEAEARQIGAMKLFAEVEPGSWEPEIWLLTYW